MVKKETVNNIIKDLGLEINENDVRFGLFRLLLTDEVSDEDVEEFIDTYIFE